ncbi:MAG TPA: BPTI/Kunitz domain-containing protein [Polyangiaceae bacterium]|nr:BPTI/Kunitz domain-containing protein [Polyangiaceae bacterium]
MRATFALAGVVVVAACGGQSLDPGTESGGSAGTSGGSGAGGAAATGGTSGSGGAGGSHAARGGTDVGGSGVGGSGVGGSGVGGSGVGGSGAGSAGSGGSAAASGSGAAAGSAGAPSAACSLPVDAGPCDAAIARYAFNPKTLRCEEFSYGGCSGNANIFETFEACVAACGLADESDCPVGQPTPGTACTGFSHPCDYSGSTGCLCQPTGQYSCAPTTSETSCFSTSARAQSPAGDAGAACTGPDCPQAIIVISYFTCSCDAGQWSCRVTGTGGAR